VWEYLANVNIPLNEKRKIRTKTEDYKISEISNNSIMESIIAIFFKNIFSLKDKLTKTISYTTSAVKDFGHGYFGHVALVLHLRHIRTR